MTQQAAERLAWPYLDEQLRARAHQRFHAVYPAHRAGYLADEGVADGLCGGHQAAGDVGGDRDAGIGQLERCEHPRHLLLRRLHQGAMEGRAYREHHGAAGAFGLGQRRGPLHGCQSARDHRLSG